MDRDSFVRSGKAFHHRDVTTPYYTKYAVWYNTDEYGVFGQIGVFIRFSPHTVIRFEFCASNVITRQYEAAIQREP